MSDWLMRVIKAEASRLIELATDDDELRADLRALAESILAATSPQTGTAEATVSTQALCEDAEDDERKADGRSGNSRWGERRRRKRLPGRWLQRRSLSQRTPIDDLVDLESRCRQKAGAAHWAAERLCRAREGNNFPTEHAPVEPEMVAWADRLMDGFYWLQSSAGSTPVDVAVVDNVGGCFDALAGGLAVRPRDVGRTPGQANRARSVATAGRGGTIRVESERSSVLVPRPTRINWRSFEWLKMTAARHHVYIKRFMRADEAADPAGWDELLARIESAAGGGQAVAIGRIAGATNS